MSVAFNIKTFDVGGRNAKKGDNKLTGEEIDLARKAGWDVGEYTSNMGTPKRIEKPTFFESMKKAFYNAKEKAKKFFHLKTEEEEFEEFIKAQQTINVVTIDPGYYSK